MLFKDLKNIVEADQPELDAEGNPIVPEKTETPVKTDKQRQLDKSTSDGIGNEAINTATTVAEFLQSVLGQSYKVGDVTSEKSMVIIKDAGEYMDSNAEEFTNAVQQYIVASIGKEGMDKFEINGPFKSGTNINIVFTLKT